MLDNLLLTNPDKKQLWMLRAVVAERENDERWHWTATRRRSRWTRSTSNCTT